jgi:ribosomal protein S18 acetylase RimI-like enzyme
MSPDQQITLRLARPEDAGSIALVHIRTWQTAYAGIFPPDKLTALDQDMETSVERWHANLTDPDRLPAFFVAETAGGQIIGFAAAGQQHQGDYPQDAELFLIYILPEYQGKGIGQRLMSASAERLIQLGFTSLILWVLEDNPDSRRFYERLGGRLAGRQSYLRWEHEYQIVAYVWDDLADLLQS